jgi:hypothetical protein
MVSIMGRLKVIVKRPVSHYLIILAYILALPVNFLTIKVIGNVPYDLILRNFFNGFGLFAGLWLITAPLVGIGFYFVNKTTWYIFLVHSSLILIDFLYKWFSKPVYYMKTVSGSHNALMFAGNIVLIIVVGYIIQKNFRAPYFQALQRHWRESVRIPIHHVITIDGMEMKIDDLSAGGCFVLKTETGLAINKEHDIFFQSDRLHIECIGVIMRQTDEGYGIMFKNLIPSQSKDIKSFLTKRFSLRQQIELKAHWIGDGISRNVTILEISKSGCFLASELMNIEEDNSGILSLFVLGKEHHIHAKISWINHKGEHKKPDGFGVSFMISHKHILKGILREHGHLEYTR